MAIRVAIIGSGIFVKDSHLLAIQQTSILTLKAVYSRSLASAKSLGVDVDLYSDDSGVGKRYDDLLLRDDIDALILALPITKQPEYIEAALAAGKHVLSEKPIAGDIKRAEQLIQFYKSDKVKGNATWGVAENFRFLDSFLYARQEVEKLGRILGFRTKQFGNIKVSDKYYNTAWRTKPDYQGGFTLDGGVHFVAGTRLLLGEEAKPTAVSAFTTLLQEHLPPVDTINAIWSTKSGISGTYSNSFGTTFSGSEYTIACEKGTVTIVGSKVIITEGEQKLGKSSEKEFPDEGNGVRQEVGAWAQALIDGVPNPRQSPEHALADLEILEKMLISGAEHGKVETLQFQV
ncbi:hypothetical protein OIDMADRAFT_155638 [Oidiodendron maius Zn]|uniref:Gfo/Idh/MocA-like oxidoreductase N-terminal domain-containing protein n=1 Tax=Oidiodendron maius (strain Zn) TaxID=913774 RepID=A0A0C3HW44_OIDMZ|nr:hypothetical protein OIDMADRAFT_155638 [Oidiodendron maius Zn]